MTWSHVQKTLQLGLFVLLTATVPQALTAQEGQIVGTIADAETAAPLSAVQVYLQGTSRGALSGTNGTFSLTGVPPGTYTVVAQRIGYREGRQSNVQVAGGESVTVNITMSANVLALQEVVATGLIDPVEGVRSPITVARVSREMMPVVVPGSAAQNLQGRVAGLSMTRTSGQPGSGETIQLRTPTSVVHSGAPLLVVDGVILGTSSATNIESFDIESIEVIKGAAAASLYGSQAAAGVIAITTNRGRDLELGQTRFTITSETGYSSVFSHRGMPTHHHFLVDDDANPTTYVDRDGNPVSRAERVALPVAFMDKPYPNRLIYDNIATAFRPASYNRQGISVFTNSATTNMALSVNRNHDGGPLVNNDGYTLQSARLNVDHRFRSNVTFGISSYYSRDYRDNISGGLNALQMPVDLDLSRRDENGEYVRIPDELIPEVNPLWAQANQENERWRDRALGSASLRWQPYSVVTFSGSASYDRQHSTNRAYTSKGTPSTNILDEEVSDGTLRYDTSLLDRWNAEAQVSFRRDLGALNARTTFRTIGEGARSESQRAEGRDFIVEGVPTISAARTLISDSDESSELSMGLLWDTAFDYDGKYIATVLLRRDGSSVFGADNRWHTYYRAAGAWRIGEEPWFDIPNVDEFKLSYSRGTAGGRPGRSAQYETWTLTGTGVPVKATLGNRDLRPEHTTEQDIGIETILFGRYSAQLNYAWQTTTNQLNNANLPAWLGFNTQWTNGGTVTGNTLELTMEGRLIQRPRFSWTTLLVADRSRAKIEEWPYPCDATIAWRNRCEGVGMYEIWAAPMLQSHDQLAGHHTGSAAGRANEFDINDEGWLVWVGEGNTYRDGIAKGLWGTTANIDGYLYRWGFPIILAHSDGTNQRDQIGDASHVNLGWINTLRLEGLTVNGHWHAALGHQVVNREYQSLVFPGMRSPIMDQSGKPDELKKPVTYYTVGAFADNAGVQYWVEDASYLKLRSVSVNYSFNPQQLGRVGLGRAGLEGLSIGLVGRNLLSFSNYTGFDPEQALNLSTRQAASAQSYPSTRHYSLEVQATF